jgi:hypothetical protein
VTGLDPTNEVLFDRYDEIVADIDQLGWADLESRGRGEMLGLVPTDWEALGPIVA